MTHASPPTGRPADSAMFSSNRFSALAGWGPRDGRPADWCLAALGRHRAGTGGGFVDEWIHFYDPSRPPSRPPLLACFRFAAEDDVATSHWRRMPEAGAPRDATFGVPTEADFQAAMRTPPDVGSACSLPPAGRGRAHRFERRPAEAADLKALTESLSGARTTRQTGEPLWILAPETLTRIGLAHGEWSAGARSRPREWWAFHEPSALAQRADPHLAWLLVRARAPEALDYLASSPRLHTELMIGT